jgi:carboxylesterase type B
VTPWHGIRSAQSYANQCPQLPSGNGPRSDTEDCLCLNVFAPPGSEGGQPARAGAGRLPVLCHDPRRRGGAPQRGPPPPGAHPPHGSPIVTTDHIVVVSINYRLGVFGFLDVPGLGTSPATANGNYGLLAPSRATTPRWLPASRCGRCTRAGG